jgi:serine phosphatase RsbU (regulator of sigma subunit)
MTTSPTRSSLRFLRRAVLGLVAAAALFAVVVTVGFVRARASEREDKLADQAVDAAETTMSNLVAGFGGAAGLVGSDGSIPIDQFDAYARDVVRGSPVQAVALVQVVPDARRGAVEQAIGRPVVDEIGGGPAARRPSYYVVRRVTPDPAGVAGALVGVDLHMDPVRSAAIARALATGDTVVSGPVGSLPSGAPALFVAKPLFRVGADGLPRTDEPVALLTSGFQGARLLEGITSALPAGSRVEVSDGGAPLAQTDPAPKGGVSRHVTVLDRRWLVRVDRPGRVGYGVVWLVALAGAVIVGALAIVMLRGERYERRLREGTDAMERLADLSRDLAAAREVDEVAQAVSSHVPAIVGARLAGIALVEPDERRLRMVCRPEIPPVLVAAFAEISLDARSAIPAAAETGEPLLLRDAAAIQSVLPPDQAAALEEAGCGAVAILPLSFRGTVTALVGVAWGPPPEAGQDWDARLRAISEVCTRTLERIEASQLLERREAALAALARRLSNAETENDITTAVFEDAGKAAGATYANIGFVDPRHRELVVQAASALPEDLAARYHRLPLHAGIPLTDAVVWNEPVWVSSPSEIAARYPAIVDDASRLGFEALVSLPLPDPSGAVAGAMGLAWSAPVEPDDGLRSTLGVLGDMTAQTLARVRVGDERAREGEINRRLGELAELLATAGSTEEVISTLAGGAAAAVDAQAADVGMVDEDRGVLHIIGGPGEGRTLPLDDPSLAPEVEAVATMSTVVRNEALEHAVVAVPLVDQRHRAIGVVAARFPTGRTIQADDLSATSRLADLGGQALQRAGLTDRERRRMTRLAAFATELSAARSLEDVIGAVARSGGRPVEGDEVSVGLVDESRGAVVLYRGPTEMGGVEHVELPIATPLDPIRDAVVRREKVTVVDADDWRRRYPDDAAVGDGRQAIAALPLWRAQGGRLGVVAVAWRRPISVDDRTEATLHLIARLSAQALQRAELHDLEHRLVADLQSRLVTDLPDVPGLAIATRYRAAGRGVEIGGDWFTGVALEGGRLGLVVGDMTGHGIRAVAGMAQVQATTSALLRAGLELDQVTEHASRFVAETASGLATAVLAIFDPPNGELSCVVAGQVPPLLLTPDGSSELLDRVRRPLLGVAGRGPHPMIVRKRFTPGSLLVAYTDGLIERRGEQIDDGIARLRRAIAQSTSWSANALADHLLDELLGGDDEQHDDVALVVIEAVGSPPTEGHDAAGADRSETVPAGA